MSSFLGGGGTGSGGTVSSVSNADGSLTVAPTTGGVVASNNLANPTAVASDVAVNGTAKTSMRSDAAPAIQKASAAQFGVVKVDGTTITAAGGVISSSGGGGGLTVGTTTVVNGQFGYLLLDNAGVLGNAPPPGLIPAGGNLTFYVAKTGNDSNPGTIGSPFLTVQRACDIAGYYNYQGQWTPQINVGAGTFDESGTAGLGLQPSQLPNLPQFTTGTITGAGAASTTIKSTGGSAVSMLGFECLWNMQSMTFDNPNSAIQVGNGAVCNFGGGSGCTITDSTASGFFSPFYVFNGAFLGLGGGGVITLPIGFHFELVLLEGFEPYFDASNSTFVFPSSNFGTPGTDSLVITDLSGGSAADGYFEWRSVTVTNAVKYLGSQINVTGVPFFVVWTTNGLLSDLPGVTTNNKVDNRTLISTGSLTCPFAVQKSGLPTTSDLFAGTFGVFKDTSGGGVYLAYNDAGTIKKVALV